MLLVRHGCGYHVSSLSGLKSDVLGLLLFSGLKLKKRQWHEKKTLTAHNFKLSCKHFLYLLIAQVKEK